MRSSHGAGPNLLAVLFPAALGLPALLFLLTPSLHAQAVPEKPAPQAAAEAAKPATYVGTEACQACHEDISNAFQRNPHHVMEVEKARGWQGKGCESCHGPGSKHAESAAAADIRNPAKLKPSEVDRLCLKCHTNTPVHIARTQNAHAKNGVSCIACHGVHKSGPEGLVARRAPAINRQCAGCHVAQWAAFQKPFHHRLPEGAMSCTDCHNPHGSVFPKMLETAFGNDRACVKCHGDKRGPFTFEHAPVRLDGCQSCHEPHGSANPKMLIRHEVRFVCLECHTNLPAPSVNKTGVIGGVIPPAFHDLRSPRFQNCTICHVKIHGSYVDRDFTR